jgi:hypothetical protein
VTDFDDPRPDEQDLSSFVLLRRFLNRPEAEVARSVLESTGMKCVLRDRAVLAALRGDSGSLGAIELCVGPDDVAEATKILDQPLCESFEVDGIGTFKQPRCPNCGSLDISLYDWDKWLVGVILVDPRVVQRSGRSWLCHSCRQEWPDSEI